MFNLKAKFNIDKLEITYQCDEATRNHINSIDYLECGEIGEISLKRIESRVYKNQFIILIPNEKESNTIFADLFFDSYNPNRPYIYLSIRNECLYDKNLLAGVSYVEQALNLNFLRISKLHISLDCNKNLINAFYRLLRNKEMVFIINNRKVESMDEEIPSLLHVSTGSRKKIHKNKSFYITNSEKDLELNAYDKTKELLETGKQYIIDNIGFSKIYRFEVRMNNYKMVNESLQMTNINNEKLYYNLFDENVLKTIFYVSINRLIRLQINRKPCSLLDVLI